MTGRNIRLTLLALIGVAIAVLAAMLPQTSAQAAAASTGCGVSLPAGVRSGQSVTQTITVDQTSRTYRLHLPTGYSPNHSEALVLAFHGHGESDTTFEGLTGFSRTANAHNFIVVYPQGEVGPDAQTGWNTGRAGVDPTSDDVGFVGALIAHLEATLCVNPGRIYVVGFSNGGGFAAVLACSNVQRLAAVGIVSGDYVSAAAGCVPAHPLPLMEIHGTADQINPYDGSAAKGEVSALTFVTAWVDRDGCASGPVVTAYRHGVTRMVWMQCAGGVTVQHEKLAGVGHVWPNGTRRTDYYNATAAFWSFFAPYSA